MQSRLLNTLFCLFAATPMSLSAADSTDASHSPVMVTTADGEVVDKGLALALETEHRDSGFGDIVATGEIINKNANGGSNRREFEMVTVEMDGDGDRRFIRVTAPATMKGTLFLSHAHALKADDVWVLLPRTPRLRRISARDKTGRFLSSELTLEDISPWQVERYSYRYIREEACGAQRDRRCHLIENSPNYQHSGYSRQLEWLDAEIYQPRRIDYFDDANQLAKTLEFDRYQQFAERYWRPMHMRMINRQSGDESQILWDNYQIGSGYTPEQVSPTNIVRLRR